MYCTVLLLLLLLLLRQSFSGGHHLNTINLFNPITLPGFFFLFA